MKHYVVLHIRSSSAALRLPGDQWLYKELEELSLPEALRQTSFIEVRGHKQGDDIALVYVEDRRFAFGGLWESPPDGNHKTPAFKQRVEDYVNAGWTTECPQDINDFYALEERQYYARRKAEGFVLCKPASRLPDSLKDIRNAMEVLVPVGFNSHSSPVVGKFFKHGEDLVFARELQKRFADITPKFLDMEARVWSQCGTLGGGNHFIELCLDTEQNVWLLLHSGSRNIGKTLAEYHINIAQTLTHNQKLPDRDLAVFLSGTPEMEAYRRDLMWAQDYAMLNRMTMVELCFSVLQKFFPDVEVQERILCHHNYVSEETHFGEDVIVTRKGAISAQAGQLGLIPGSMGARSFVVRGLGNPESFRSASHGAGRRMSRGAAKRRFTVADVEQQTQGVECRKDAGVIDEIPAAYKGVG